MKTRKVLSGWFVMKFGGGRYTSVAWFAQKENAENEVKRIVTVGCWSGMPPKIEPSYTS